jgi:hypothetical protein
MWAFTANARIAPSAIKKILPPMPMRALLGSRLLPRRGTAVDASTACLPRHRNPQSGKLNA